MHVWRRYGRFLLLLGHAVLGAPPVARNFAVGQWTLRARTEVSAANEFSRLHDLLTTLQAPAALGQLAARSASDEAAHYELCQKVLAQLEAPLVASSAQASKPGAAKDALSDCLLTAVAASCITESLATALLLEIADAKLVPCVDGAVSRIVRDEVKHSHLGWSILAWAAPKSDLSWIAPQVPSMIALATGPLGDVPQEPADLTHWGILSVARSRQIVQQTLTDVVLPGLRHFGIAVAAD